MKIMSTNLCPEYFPGKESVYRLGRLLMIVIPTFSILPAGAQVSIRGTIRDQNKQPLPYATVLLLHSVDTTLAAGTMTDDQGSFAVDGKVGTYILNVSMVGYGPYSSRIEVNAGQREIRLDTLILSEDVRELEGVVVKAQRPFFEKKIDRIDINVQNSVTSAGGTALEVLAKSPGVTVNRQTSSISMNGKTGVLVMIDGKASRLPMDAVVQMLDGMSSANIGKIELITTPPAKYDAEGNAGIINIVMKTSPDQGLNGNAGINAGFSKGEILGANLRLNQRSKKLNYFLSYSVRYERTIQLIENRRYLNAGDFNKTDFSFSERKPGTTVQNLRTGLEYDITKKTVLSFLVGAYQRNWDMNASTDNFNAVAPDTMYTTNMAIHEINIWKSLSIGTDITHRFGEKHEVSLNFDYLYYHNKNPSGYVNTKFVNSDAGSENENIQVRKITPVNFKITGLDYRYRINPDVLMEAGIKGTLSEFSNNVTVRRSVLDAMEIDPQASSNSSLDERIYAAYWSYEWTISPKLNMHGGLRYEYTHTVLDSAHQNELINRRSGNLFPGMSLSWELRNNNKIQFSYYRRITRPTFNQMAPFVFFLGPKTYFSGNLALKPSVMDGIELGFNLKQWWLTFKYSYTRNEIARFQPEVNTESGVQVYRAQNLEYLRIFGISTILPFQVTSWWKMNNDASLFFQTSKTLQYVKNVQHKSTNLKINSINTFTLPWKMTAELSANYQSATFVGITRIKPSGEVNIGIRKEFRNSASISMAVNDVFNTSVWRLESISGELNIRSHERIDWGTRSVILTYSHNFGNRTLKDVNIHSHTEDERKRVQ